MKPSLRTLGTVITAVSSSCGCDGGVTTSGQTTMTTDSGTTAANSVIIEDAFNTYKAPENWSEGSNHGDWRCVFNGCGLSGIQATGNHRGQVLFEKPMASTSPSETHAALVVSCVSDIHDFTMKAWVQTVAQLRQNTVPKPWERCWLIWHHAYEGDFHRFYYFIAKANGWELGKTDPAYPGGQRFLLVGSSPSFPLGRWIKIRITQSGSTISVWVNDRKVVDSFTDHERPYVSGSVGFYSEDAHVMVDDILVTSP